jgi:hypothetical protein
MCLITMDRCSGLSLSALYSTRILHTSISPSPIKKRSKLQQIAEYRRRSFRQAGGHQLTTDMWGDGGGSPSERPARATLAWRSSAGRSAKSGGACSNTPKRPMGKAPNGLAAYRRASVGPSVFRRTLRFFFFYCRCLTAPIFSPAPTPSFAALPFDTFRLGRLHATSASSAPSRL